MSRVKRASLALLAVAGILLAGCSSSTSGPSAGGGGSSGSPAKLASFKIATFSGEIYALDYIAKQQGFFKQHGLDVTFVSPSAGGGAANTLLLAGSVQAWSGNPQVILGDISKGEKIVFAGALENWIPYAIQVPKGSPLAKMSNASFSDKMKALRGKKIGLTGVGALVYLDLQTALKLAGVDPKSVTILGVGGPSNGVGQLNAGRLDAYVTYSRADALIMQREANTTSFADLSGNNGSPAQLKAFSSFAFPVLQSFASAHPNQVSDYMGAIKDAYNWAKANVDQAAKIIADAVYQGKDVAEVKTAFTQLFAIPQDPNFAYNKSTLTGEIALLAQLGQLPSSAPSDPRFSYQALVMSSARTN